MTTTAITFTVATDMLSNYTDEHVAALWHIAQANPAPFGDPEACAFAEQIGREIISRWLGTVPPALWNHQGRHMNSPSAKANALPLTEEIKLLLGDGKELTTREIAELLALDLSAQSEGDLRSALLYAGATIKLRTIDGTRRRMWSISPAAAESGAT
jgi:hypothetical protein